jgi:hypothetical protein
MFTSISIDSKQSLKISNQGPGLEREIAMDEFRVEITTGQNICCAWVLEFK